MEFGLKMASRVCRRLVADVTGEVGIVEFGLYRLNVPHLLEYRYRLHGQSSSLRDPGTSIVPARPGWR